MSDRDGFERAFVAVTYLLGRRDGLVEGLGATAGESARTLAEELVRAAHVDRARTLASELMPVVAALDARGIG
jgi:hypothetical protein